MPKRVAQAERVESGPAGDSVRQVVATGAERHMAPTNSAAEREHLREQRRAEQELAAEWERLEKEKAHYVSVLKSLRAKATMRPRTSSRRGSLISTKAIVANDYRIANIRAGYVYVISNVGAFGPNVVKIGKPANYKRAGRVR